MKRIKLFFILSLFFHTTLLVYAQPDTFSITPLNIYVGDEVEIRCVISTVENSIPVDIKDNKASLIIDKEYSLKVEEFCTIKSMVINKQENTLTLDVVCIPWKVGVIELPAFNLYEMLPNYKAKENDLWNVQLPSITVLSIMDKTNLKTLQPVSPPVIIPGTTYLIYGAIVLFIVILVFICIFFARIKNIRKRFSDFLRKLFLSRIYKSAKRRIRVLSRRMDSITDEAFANELSHIIRDYLENLFDLPFTAATPKEVNSLFMNAYKGLISDQQQEIVHKIYETLVRLDYLRFSATQDKLSKTEKNYLLDQANELLVFWELEED